MQKEIINNTEYIQWQLLPLDVQEELGLIMSFNEEKRRSESVHQLVGRLQRASQNYPPDHKIFKAWVYENFEYTSKNMTFFFKFKLNLTKN